MENRYIERLYLGSTVVQGMSCLTDHFFNFALISSVLAEIVTLYKEKRLMLGLKRIKIDVLVCARYPVWHCAACTT